MLIAHLFVHEGFGATGERAFERSLVTTARLFGLYAVRPDDGGGGIRR